MKPVNADAYMGLWPKGLTRNDLAHLALGIRRLLAFVQVPLPRVGTNDADGFGRISSSAEGF